MQPVRKENSSNYKYDFPETWLGLEKEALQEATGLSDVSFCHKGGFLLTAETLDDAVAACRISLAGMPKAPVLIHIGTDAIDADDPFCAHSSCPLFLCPLHRRYEATRGLTVGTGVKRLDPPGGGSA